MRRIVGSLGALFGGLVVVVVVCLGTPAALVALAVMVWPHTWAWSDVGVGRLGVLVADAAAWIVWGVYLSGLVSDVADRVRHPERFALRRGARAAMAGWVAGLVLLVVPAAAVVGSAAGATSAPITVAAPAPSSVVPSSAVVANSAPGSTRWTSAGTSAVLTQSETVTYTVVPGDCLSTIAERYYGEEGAWTEIWAANADALMSGGERFTDPNLILPGWNLTVPGVPEGPNGAPATAATPPQASSPAPTSNGASPTALAPSVAGSTTTVTTGTGADPATTSGEGHPTAGPAAPTTLPGRQPLHRGTSHEPRSHPGYGPQSGPAGTSLVRWLPESVALGVGALVAAALVRRMRRARARARAARRDDEVVPLPSREAVAVEAMAAPFAATPALDWLELANRCLTAALRARARTDDMPGVRFVRVGPAGVELLLSEPRDWAPDGFEVADEGHTWVLPARADRASLTELARGEVAWVPVLVPVGEDPSGAYLVALGPGEALSVEGAGSEVLLATMALAAGSWPWDDQVTVTADPERAEVTARIMGGDNRLEGLGAVLYTGTPDQLSPDTWGRVALLGRALAAADVRVMVSGERAVIEPLGIAVRPSLLGSMALNVVAEAEAALAPVVDPEPPPAPVGGLVEPGSVEVRLLTYTPTITGLAEPLPSRLVARVTELVAWLALRGERGATSASIMDEAVAGAQAPKTVYNIVSHARAALGTDVEGRPRLQADRGVGLYRLSPEVTVDVLRFEAMVEAGVAACDPTEATVLCEAALALVEDRPVGNGSGRYGWWSAAWEARVGRLAVKAARRLVELATQRAIDPERATQAVAKAHLAAEDDEELARVAIALAALADNPQAAVHEWASVCASAEALESGTGPSAETEALYLAIRRRLRVEASSDLRPAKW